MLAPLAVYAGHLTILDDAQRPVFSRLLYCLLINTRIQYGPANVTPNLSKPLQPFSETILEF